MTPPWNTLQMSRLCRSCGAGFATQQTDRWLCVACFWKSAERPEALPHRRHWGGIVECPVHYPERGVCSMECWPQRQAYKVCSQALRAYWWHRRHGQQPMAAARYLKQFYRTDDG